MLFLQLTEEDAQDSWLKEISYSLSCTIISCNKIREHYFMFEQYNFSVVYGRNVRGFTYIEWHENEW
jgi:hypothetical protein